MIFGFFIGLIVTLFVFMIYFGENKIAEVAKDGIVTYQDKHYRLVEIEVAK